MSFVTRDSRILKIWNKAISPFFSVTDEKFFIKMDNRGVSKEISGLLITCPLLWSPTDFVFRIKQELLTFSAWKDVSFFSGGVRHPYLASKFDYCFCLFKKFWQSDVIFVAEVILGAWVSLAWPEVIGKRLSEGITEKCSVICHKKQR